MLLFSGAKVEDAFLETARKIYQNIQDGRLDLNASESGVQHKPSQPGRTSLSNDTAANKDNCSCQFNFVKIFDHLFPRTNFQTNSSETLCSARIIGHPTYSLRIFFWFFSKDEEKQILKKIQINGDVDVSKFIFCEGACSEVANFLYYREKVEEIVAFTSTCF